MDLSNKVKGALNWLKDNIEDAYLNDKLEEEKVIRLFKTLKVKKVSYNCTDIKRYLLELGCKDKFVDKVTEIAEIVNICQDVKVFDNNTFEEWRQ